VLHPRLQLDLSHALTEEDCFASLLLFTQRLETSVKRDETSVTANLAHLCRLHTHTRTTINIATLPTSPMTPHVLCTSARGMRPSSTPFPTYTFTTTPSIFLPYDSSEEGAHHIGLAYASLLPATLLAPALALALALAQHGGSNGLFALGQLGSIWRRQV
jgi:hypothetical protein